MNRQILGVGPRVAALLKDVYPRNTAKLIAGDLSVSISTVERWLAGHAPTVLHLEEMYGRWGERFVRAVFCEAFVANDERVGQLRAAQGGAFTTTPHVSTTSAIGTAVLGGMVGTLFGRVKGTIPSVASADEIARRRMRLIARLLETVPEPPR
jgi:hypothetical protein